MKRILIASNTDFRHAEAISMLVNETKNILNCNNQIDTFMLPFNRNGDDIAQMLAIKMLDVKDACDVLITVDYPACLIRHERKICIYLESEDSMDATKIGFDEQNCLKYKDGQFYFLDGSVANIDKEVEKL